MESPLNEETSIDRESINMRNSIIVTLIALAMVVILMQPDQGEQTIKTAEAAPVAEVEPKVEEKKKTLTLQEKIDTNHYKCDQDHWIRADNAKCLKKQTPVIVNMAQAPSGTCDDWMGAAGITDKVNAYTLIMRDSGCNPNAVNANGGACGIGQQLPCGKWPHAWNDPVGGMIDMQNYVMGRYGSWANALAHSNINNWY